MKSSRGFTLIELVIALMLLTFLSIFTAQSIQRAIKDKTRLQGDLDRSARLRGTLSVIERDLNLAFNHRDMGVELHNMAINIKPTVAGSGAGAPPGGTPPPPPPPIGGSGAAPPTATPQNQHPQMQPKKEVLLTQFVGEAEKLNFATASLVRLEVDSPTADIGEVGYELKNCNSRMDPSKSSKCLWRRTTNVIDTDPLVGGGETALLEDVKELKFRYLGPLKPEEWQDVWDSSNTGPAETKGILPYAVEVTLEIQDKVKALRMTIVAAIHNPNNPEKKDDQVPGQTTPK